MTIHDVTPAPGGRGRRRKARTIAAILDAAERRLGSGDLRIEDVAADADVAIGSIYNHFGNKEGLEQALVDRALELFVLYMDDGRDSALPALEQLLDTAGRLARFGREQSGHLRLLVRARESDRVAAELSEQERRTAALVEAAVRQGAARPLDARHTAAFLWSSWLGTLTIGAADEASLRGRIEAGLRVVLGGLASDGARESSDFVRAVLEPAPVRRSRAMRGRPGLSLRREAVAPDLRAEFPEVALWTATVDASRGRAPAAVARRLATLRDRLGGTRVVGVREESIPWAYRVFARRVGVDQAATHDPVDRAALERLGAADVETRGLPADALLVAALETGVPVLAFDADLLDGPLTLRRGEPGGAVIADAIRPLAVLFGDRDPAVAPKERTERIALAALQVKGVPDLTVQQALWTAAELLGGR